MSGRTRSPDALGSAGDRPCGQIEYPRTPSLCDRVAVWVNEGGAGGDDETREERLGLTASARLPWLDRADEPDVKPI
jgi:hypothetical protein